MKYLLLFCYTPPPLNLTNCLCEGVIEINPGDWWKSLCYKMGLKSWDFFIWTKFDHKGPLTSDGFMVFGEIFELPSALLSKQIKFFLHCDMPFISLGAFYSVVIAEWGIWSMHGHIYKVGNFLFASRLQWLWVLRLSFSFCLSLEFSSLSVSIT